MLDPKKVDKIDREDPAFIAEVTVPEFIAEAAIPKFIAEAVVINKLGGKRMFTKKEIIAARLYEKMIAEESIETACFMTF